MENKKVRFILRKLAEGIEAVRKSLRTREIDEWSVLEAAFKLFCEGKVDRAVSLAGLIAKPDLYHELADRRDAKALLLLPYTNMNHYYELKKWLRVLTSSELPWLIIPFLNLKPEEVIDIIRRYGAGSDAPNIAIALTISAYKLASSQALDEFFTEFFRSHLSDKIIYALIQRLRQTKLESEAKAVLWLLYKIPEKLPPKATLSAAIAATYRHPKLLLSVSNLIGSLANYLQYEELKNLALALSRSKFDQLRELAARVAIILTPDDALKVLSRLALDQKMKIRRAAAESLLMFLDEDLLDAQKKHVAMLLIRTRISKAIIAGLNTLSQEGLNPEEVSLILKVVRGEKRSSVIRAVIRFLESHGSALNAEEIADVLTRYLTFAVATKKANLLDEILCYIESSDMSQKIAEIILRQKLPKLVEKRLKRILKKE